LVLDQFRNSCTFHGSICEEVACSTCVLHHCVRCWICIWIPIIANCGPSIIRQTECIWKWNLGTVAHSCTTRLGSTSCGTCSVGCQTWKSRSAIGWRVARCAIPWLSYVRGAIVLSWESALSTDPALSSNICKW
jgi:hypothetical protein